MNFLSERKSMIVALSHCSRLEVEQCECETIHEANDLDLDASGLWDLRIKWLRDHGKWPIDGTKTARSNQGG